MLRVKGSGSDLKSIQRKDFPGVAHGRHPGAPRAPGHGRPGDGRLLRPRPARARRARARPSRRCSTASSPADASSTPTPTRSSRSPTTTARPTCSARCTATTSSRSRICARASPSPAGGPDASRRIPRRGAILLEKHGTICWGATVKEAYLATIELISRAEEAIAHRAKGRARFGGVGRDGAGAGARGAAWRSPWRRALRGLLGRDRRVVLTFDDSAGGARVRRLARGARALSQVGPATPDHTIYTKRLPCFVPRRPTRRDPAAVTGGGRARRCDALRRATTRRTSRPQRRRRELTGPVPARRRWWPGSACSPRARTARTAGIVDDIYHHTISVLGAAVRVRPLRLALRRRTPSTSSTGRSSSTSSRWRRRRRSWPAASRSSRAGRPASAAPSRCGWPPRARTWSSPTSTRRARARSPTRYRGGRRAAARPRPRHGRHQRGLGARGVRGRRARLRRPRHRRLQRRHRALRARSTARRWPTGSARSP